MKAPRSKDGDHIDIFIGEHPSSLLVFVVNQQTLEGKFDEIKVMMGFKTKDEAIAAYDAAFTGDLGPKLRESVMSVTVDQFKAWVAKGDTKKPFKPIEESLVQEMQHFGQEREYDCGPTCIKMVANVMGKAKDQSIGDITELCGSDEFTGTDDKRMITGMQAVGVPFLVGKAKDTAGLEEALSRGSFIILRTLTRGIKHWVVIYAFQNGKFLVNDPWLGRLSYTPEEVTAIWAARDYYYFEIPKANESLTEGLGETELVKVTDDVIPALEVAIVEAFPAQASWVVPYVLGYMDPDISVVALGGDVVLGFYILGRRQLADGVKDQGLKPTENLKQYAAKKGVEGVALGVVPSARGLGLGSRFKDFPKSLGVDYVWGLQLHELDNLQHWLKRRRVVAKDNSMVATLQDFTGVGESLLQERYDVVVGSIGMDGVIRSEESTRAHREVGIQRGQCWRYNPMTKVVYWCGDSSEHDVEDEGRVEQHLLDEYGYAVRSHIALETLMGDDFSAAHNVAHGVNDLHESKVKSIVNTLLEDAEEAEGDEEFSPRDYMVVGSASEFVLGLLKLDDDWTERTKAAKHTCAWRVIYNPNYKIGVYIFAYALDEEDAVYFQVTSGKGSVAKGSVPVDTAYALVADLGYTIKKCDSWERMVSGVGEAFRRWDANPDVTVFESEGEGDEEFSPRDFFVATDHNVCERCNALLTARSSVVREYVPKDESCDSVYCYGHYTQDGDFEPDESPSGDLDGCDLLDDSDFCNACGHKTIGLMESAPVAPEDEGDEEFNPRDYFVAPPNVKPFGYVLKSEGSRYPWMGSYYSDSYDCNGDWRKRLGDAKVFKRLSTTKNWPHLTAVPIYSDPRRTGDNALDPYYQPKPKLQMPPEPWAESLELPAPPEEGDEEFDPRAYILKSEEDNILIQRGFELVVDEPERRRFTRVTGDTIICVDERPGIWYVGGSYGRNGKYQHLPTMAARAANNDDLQELVTDVEIQLASAMRHYEAEAAGQPAMESEAPVVPDDEGDEEFNPRDYTVTDAGAKELVAYLQSKRWSCDSGDRWVDDHLTKVKQFVYKEDDYVGNNPRFPENTAGMWIYRRYTHFRNSNRPYTQILAERTVGDANEVLAAIKRYYDGQAELTMEAEELPPVLPDEGDEEFNPRDYVVSGGYGEYSEAMSFAHASKLNIWGSVMRNSSHYVHEKSTDFEMTWEWDFDRDEFPDEEDEMAIQNRVDAQLSNLRDGIAEEIVNWNHKIYRELEAAYDWSVSDEVVAENILSNGHVFDEDGGQDGDCEYTYDQLSDAAKRTARESWVADITANDNDYANSVVSEWKWLLAQKGFDDVEINWSGFWSQGDGASFTAKHFDIERYFAGRDPLALPEQERDQLAEAIELPPEEEGDEEFNPRDYVVTKPVRRDRNRLSDLPIAKQLVIECEGQLYVGERTTIGACKNDQHLWRLLVWIEGNPVMLGTSSLHMNANGTYRVRTRRRDGSQVELELEADEPVVAVHGHPDPFRKWKADVSAVDIVPTRYPVREAEEEGDEEFNPRDYVVQTSRQIDANDFQDFIHGYMETAMKDCAEGLTTNDLDLDLAAKMRADCEKFILSNWDLFDPEAYYVTEPPDSYDGTDAGESHVGYYYAGRDFWEARNGSSERFYCAHRAATLRAVDYAKQCGPVYLTLDADGKIREEPEDAGVNEAVEPEGDEEFNPRDYVVTPDRSVMARATDLSGDIWSDDAKLKRAFSWLTKIGLAPKFGTTSIHRYQQMQIEAIDKLKALAAAKGIQMQWVRYKKGNVYVYDARQWHPLAHVYNGEATPLTEAEGIEPEGDEEFDPREYFVSGQKIWFEVDGKPMAWDYERDRNKNIPLYGGKATLRLQYGSNNAGPKWWIDIDANLPWKGSLNLEDIVHITTITGADEIKLQKLIAKALAKADAWWDRIKWGYDLYAEFHEYAAEGWFEFTSVNRGLPTSYDEQTPESCAAWRQLKAQFEREHPVTESADKGLNPFGQPKIPVFVDTAFEAWLGEKSGFAPAGDGRWLRQEGDIKSVVENNGDGFYRFTVYERCRQKSNMVLTSVELAPRMEALTLL